MLAVGDQENLVHGLQAAAASKPLNQGIRQLPPKTPNNKHSKTPFGLSLKDENSTMMFGGGAKLGFKTAGKGNENLKTVGNKEGLGDKNTFVTPIGMSITTKFCYCFVMRPRIDGNRSAQSSSSRSKDNKC